MKKNCGLIPMVMALVSADSNSQDNQHVHPNTIRAHFESNYSSYYSN